MAVNAAGDFVVSKCGDANVEKRGVVSRVMSASAKKQFAVSCKCGAQIRGESEVLLIDFWVRVSLGMRMLR